MPNQWAQRKTEFVQPQKTIVAGFLFHEPSGKVLRHLRSADAPTNPGQWAFFGGKSEPEDNGDPVVAWHREMREEIGVELDPARVMSDSRGDPRGRTCLAQFLVPMARA